MAEFSEDYEFELMVELRMAFDHVLKWHQKHYPGQVKALTFAAGAIDGALDDSCIGSDQVADKDSYKRGALQAEHLWE